MKHLLFVLMIALSTATVYGQGQRYNAPFTYGNTLTLEGALNAAGTSTFSGPAILSSSMTNNGATVYGTEVASVHLYTVTGAKPIVNVTTTRLDTLKFFAANMTAGQIIRIITTTAANDSTCLLPNAGTINGGTSYWHTGATGTYKTATLFYDGTNYFVKP